jgi:hypothetical protein
VDEIFVNLPLPLRARGVQIKTALETLPGMKQAFHLRRDPYACAAVTHPSQMYMTIPKFRRVYSHPRAGDEIVIEQLLRCRTRKAGIKYPLLQRKATSGGDAESAGTQSAKE